MSTPQSHLLTQLKKYQPFDQDEKIELIRLINFLENNQNVYSRQNLTGHLTASCWITNPDRTKALLIHHNIYNCWAPIGGHADDETDLAQVALKEAHEESGLTKITLNSPEIIDIASTTVQPHQKNGYPVPLHFHFDNRFLFTADDNEPLNPAKREVSAAQWFDVKEIPNIYIDIMPIIKRVIKKIHQS